MRQTIALIGSFFAVVGSSAGPAGLSAQIWIESPPWGSTHRAVSMGIVAQPSAGGPVPPAAAAPAWAPPKRNISPGPQLALPPSVSAWQEPVRARPTATAPVEMPAKAVAHKRTVTFTASYPAGSIVIVNRERALYHVGADGKAVRYPVAIGSFTEEWTGLEFVTDKKVSPTWHPVQEPGKELREPVQGGDPANPLGVRALYLGRTLWRIHGTPASDTIGQAVSAGCIRMHNDHVVELFDRVMLGTEVYVVDKLTDSPPVTRGRKVIE